MFAGYIFPWIHRLAVVIVIFVPSIRHSLLPPPLFPTLTSFGPYTIRKYSSTIQ